MKIFSQLDGSHYISEANGFYAWKELQGFFACGSE
jgi:hypothetical protein